MPYRCFAAFKRLPQALAITTFSLAFITTPVFAAKSVEVAEKTVAKTAKTKQKVAQPAVKPLKKKTNAKQNQVANKGLQVTRTRTAAASKNGTKAVAGVAAVGAAAVVAGGAKPSFGQIAGLHRVQDPLALKSSVALVVDQETQEVLLRKNDHAVLPIASITKLMTGLLVAEANLPMDEVITITQADVDTEKHSPSRLRVGTKLTRSEMLHLALMSSENRAAHALGRTYPGGLAHFVSLMNAKAKTLGMSETQFIEPTGLSSSNQSSAHDLATLVNAAHANSTVRHYSVSPSHEVAVGRQMLQFNNTNRLVKSERWDIGVQKTGYISEAGRCLVMQTDIAGRKLIMVFLDSVGQYSRLADAERVRKWVESGAHVMTASK